MRFPWLVLLMLLTLLLAGCTDGDPGDDDDGADDDGGDAMDDGDSMDDGGVDDGDAMGGDDGNTTDDGGNQTPRRDPVTWHVTIQGNDFVDGSLTIQVGDTVTWAHADGSTPHSVTADDGAFDSGACPGAACMTQFANAEFSFTFDAVGAFPYHCRVHPSMTDTITVLERSDAAPE